MVLFRSAAAGLLLGVLAACASHAPPAKPGSAAAAKSNVNLAGFPPMFQKGYADGCASIGGRTVRDEKLYGSDAQYVGGWRDGRDICGGKR